MPILKILDTCINCDVCETNCPNQAIFFDDDKEYYQIQINLCTFCQGHYDVPRCQSLCPVECINLFEEEDP